MDVEPSDDGTRRGCVLEGCAYEATARMMTLSSIFAIVSSFQAAAHPDSEAT